MDKITKIQNFIKGLSENEINSLNQKEIQNHENQYREFKERFSKGECYLCDSPLSSFQDTKPCVHWLLKPKGFRKEHFKLILEKFNYSNIDSYLRWVANQDANLKNINDLSEEMSELRVFEYIIKYKNFEWSFSCSKADYAGHKGRRQGNLPHHHFQMRVDNKPFINFGDFHILLSDYDIYTLKVKKNELEGIQHYEGYGAGMEAFFNNLSPEEILKYAKTTDDEEKASIHTSYFIEAEPGKKIRGEDIAEILKESNKTNTPIWNLLPKLKNARGKALVSPGEGVPEIFRRKGRNKKKDGQERD